MHSAYSSPFPILRYDSDLCTPLKRVFVAHEACVPKQPALIHLKRKPDAVSESAPECSGFSPVHTSSTSKRTKFEPKRRAEVADIRHKGACLRCRLDKITCSTKWPCESCNRSHVSDCARVSKRQWMYCVPFSFKDVDIYNMGKSETWPSIWDVHADVSRNDMQKRSVQHDRGTLYLPHCQGYSARG